MDIYPYDFSRPHKLNDNNIASFIKAAKKKYHTINMRHIKRYKKPGITIYRIQKDGKIYLGFVALSKVQDYLDNIIVKHELTILEKEEQQRKLLNERDSFVKPVLLTYRSIPNLEGLIRAYTNNHPSDEFYLIEDDNLHEKWHITNQKLINEFITLIKPLDKCYIADGHHRSAAMAQQYLDSGKDEKYALMMTAFFSLDNLDIHSFHRIIVDPNRFDNNVDFLLALKKLFLIKPIFHSREALRIPLSKHQMLLLYENEWMKLEWRSDVLNNHSLEEQLDSSLFNQYVCQGIFDCKNIQEDTRISYLEETLGIDILLQKSLEMKGTFVFVLPRLHRDQFEMLVSEGTILPPKSTLFEPRLKNGIIIQEL